MNKALTGRQILLETAAQKIAERNYEAWRFEQGDPITSSRQYQICQDTEGFDYCPKYIHRIDGTMKFVELIDGVACDKQSGLPSEYLYPTAHKYYMGASDEALKRLGREIEKKARLLKKEMIDRYDRQKIAQEYRAEKDQESEVMEKCELCGGKIVLGISEECPHCYGCENCCSCEHCQTCKQNLTEYAECAGCNGCEDCCTCKEDDPVSAANNPEFIEDEHAGCREKIEQLKAQIAAKPEPKMKLNIEGWAIGLVDYQRISIDYEGAGLTTEYVERVFKNRVNNHAGNFIHAVKIHAFNVTLESSSNEPRS